MRPLYRLTLFGLAVAGVAAVACRDVIDPRGRGRPHADVGDTAGDSIPGDSVPGDSIPADSVLPDTGGITLAPLCGGSFSVFNARDTAVRITYTVGDAARRDTLRLPPRPSDTTRSETYLTVVALGTVRLFSDTLLLAQAEPAGGTCPDRARLGEWTPTFGWPMVPVHTSLLPDGRVLAFGRNGTPQVFTPDSLTGTWTSVPNTTTHIFCGGHAFLPDGRLLVTGGHIASDRGLRHTNIFDPATLTWTRVADMARGRWYPTSTTLASGDVLTIGGADSNKQMVGVPEVWQTATGTWRRLTNASRTFPYYPRTFVAPNGRVFNAGIQRTSRWLSTAGRGTWTTGPVTNYGYEREYGSAVMYDDGRIMIVGGGGRYSGRLPTATAEVIDLNSASPRWQYTGQMANRRRQLNATVVPTGEVIATGGTRGTGFNNEALSVFEAEAWSRATGRWRRLATGPTMRVYHSIALLLPDGRILSGGGGEADTSTTSTTLPNAEYFLPPYLFRPDGARADRPAITEAPPEVGYGQQFLVKTPDGGSIRQARWIRLGSVTHAYDENQRANTLAVEPAPGGVTVTAPASGNLAPPGHYTLFLIDHNGVPSVGRIVRVR